MSNKRLRGLERSVDIKGASSLRPLLFLETFGHFVVPGLCSRVSLTKRVTNVSAERKENVSKMC